MIAKINESNVFAYLSRGGLALTLLLSFVSYFACSPKFAGGVMAGGTLAIANFYWLRNILQRALQLQSQIAPRYAVLRYLLRLGVLAVVIYLLVTSGVIDIFGLITGLSVLVINIIALSVYMSLKGG